MSNNEHSHKVYAVRDARIDSFLKPMFAKADGEMLRIFQDLCQDTNTMFNRHPADYELFHVGFYEETNAQMVSIKPKSLGGALDYVGQDRRTAEINNKFREAARRKKQQRKETRTASERVQN